MKPLAVLLVFASVMGFIACTNAESLSVTLEHPFLLNGSWVEAQELNEGDILYTLDGQQVKIINVTRVVPETSIAVYNLEAWLYHDFVVGPLGLVVHNSNKIKYPAYPPSPPKKPASWTNDQWNEYLLEKSGKFAARTPSAKRPAVVGDQIVHFEGETDFPGAGGAVFFEEGSAGKRVIKVSRGDGFIDESWMGNPMENAQNYESYYIQEVENMELANRLGLRKFYGEVEIVNKADLLNSQVYPYNKNLLAQRAYSMDYVDGGWPSEMKQYITKETYQDAVAKYRKLWDAGYVQSDFQFLVTREGKAEIIDFGGVGPRSDQTWDEIVSSITVKLGI